MHKTEFHPSHNEKVEKTGSRVFSSGYFRRKQNIACDVKQMKYQMQGKGTQIGG